MMDSGFRMYIQYNIFLSLLLQKHTVTKQPISLSVHLMEPSASQPNSSFKRLDVLRNDTIKDGV